MLTRSLRKLGYRTHISGKWHIGEVPENRAALGQAIKRLRAPGDSETLDLQAQHVGRFGAMIRRMAASRPARPSLRT